MIKRILAAVLLAVIAVSISSCSIENDGSLSNDSTTATTQKETRIHNSFKDVLPDFGFDNAPVENYREGVSYSFSAQCSEREYEKYIDAVKKAGFEVKAVEASGYYSAYTADKYYVEITLINDIITVYVKR